LRAHPPLPASWGHSRACSFNAKLADFGAAREVAIDMTSNVGTPLYRAPETMTATQVTRYDASADIYSAGLVVWATMHLEHNPFPHYTKALDLARGVLTGERPPINDELFAFDGGARLKQLMMAMWQGDPGARPTAQQALDELEAVARVAGFSARPADTPGSHPVTLQRYGDVGGRTPATGLSSLGSGGASPTLSGSAAGAGAGGPVMRHTRGVGGTAPSTGDARRGALGSSAAGSSLGRTVASFEVDVEHGRTAAAVGRSSGGVGATRGHDSAPPALGSMPSSLVAVNDGLAGLGLGSRARTNLYRPAGAGVGTGGRDGSDDDDEAGRMTAVAAAVASPFADRFGP